MSRPVAPHSRPPQSPITGDPERDHELLMLGRTIWQIVKANCPDYERFRSRSEEDDA